MNNSLSEDYLRWLEPQIRDKKSSPEKEYWDLLRIMFNKEFVWFVPNDDNRMADGLDLRLEFCTGHHIPVHLSQELGPASFLEVLIGLSRRLAFAAGGEAPVWAWQLVGNLKLHKMSDPLSRRKVDQADDIINACIWRTYQPNGQGGFFPLAWSDEDQTKIEIWYQMAAYIDELHPEY